MTATTTTATCDSCTWHTSGSMKAVDRAAEKHTKTTGHGTVTDTRPREGDEKE